jgi:hypothetical protein
MHDGKSSVLMYLVDGCFVYGVCCGDSEGADGGAIVVVFVRWLTHDVTMLESTL